MQNNDIKFNLIIKAAETHDASLLPEDVSIDIRKVGEIHLTAAGELARLNKQQAALFLLNHGANISYIACGAARGGHKEWAEDLVKKGADISLVAYGAAVSGDQVWSEKLMKQGADIDNVALGAALSSNASFVTDLIHNGADIDSIGYAAGLKCNALLVKDSLDRGAKIDWIIEAAAVSGQKSFVNFLIKKYGDNNIDLSEYGYGVALGGHHEWLMSVIQPDAISKRIFLGLARCGDYSLLDKLIDRSENTSSIVSSMVDAGHLNSEQAILRWLSCYSGKLPLRKWVDSIVDHSDSSSGITAVPEQLLDRAKSHLALKKAPNLFAHLGRGAGFTFTESLILTEPTDRYIGALYFLQIAFSNEGLPRVLQHKHELFNCKLAIAPDACYIILAYLFNFKPMSVINFGRKLVYASVVCSDTENSNNYAYSGLRSLFSRALPTIEKEPEVAVASRTSTSL